MIPFMDDVRSIRDDTDTIRLRMIQTTPVKMWQDPVYIGHIY